MAKGVEKAVAAETAILSGIGTLIVANCLLQAAKADGPGMKGPGLGLAPVVALAATAAMVAKMDAPAPPTNGKSKS